MRGAKPDSGVWGLLTCAALGRPFALPEEPRSTRSPGLCDVTLPLAPAIGARGLAAVDRPRPLFSRSWQQHGEAASCGFPFVSTRSVLAPPFCLGKIRWSTISPCHSLSDLTTTASFSRHPHRVPKHPFHQLHASSHPAAQISAGPFFVCASPRSTLAPCIRRLLGTTKHENLHTITSPEQLRPRLRPESRRRTYNRPF